jgi:D-allose transport system substrate-binding protein
MAMGVAQAVANAGKTGKILVVGTDGVPEARKMVEAGQMTATVAQNPADIGATGLKMMVDAAKTGKVIPLDKAGIQAGRFNPGHEVMQVSSA